MKLLTIFKTAQNKKFNFTPRYYDPIKEEIKERTNAIRKQLDGTETGIYQSNISKAFTQRSRRQSSINMMQFLFVIAFIAVAIAYLYYGPIALYSFLIVLPIYIVIKLRKNI